MSKVKVEDAIDARIEKLKKRINDPQIKDEDVPGVYEELKTLYELKKMDIDSYRVEPKVKDWTSVITAGIGLAGIISILTFERFDVITSKALNIATRMIK